MRILIPVDGSKHSRTAVDFIAARATLMGSDPQIEVVNVQLPVPMRATRVVGNEVVRSYYTDEAEEVLKSVRSRLEKVGLAPKVRFVVGNPAEEIAAIAAKTKADLLVMGSHGRSAFKGLLLGSVTNAVLARSKTPLLLLRGHNVPSADSLAVGIAVDGSKYGRAAVKFVARHRELFGTEPKITLIHVAPDYAGAVMADMAGMALPAYTQPEIDAMQKRSFEAAVGPARKELLKAKIDAREVCLAGNAGDELAAYAKKRKLDLLVMGSHGYGAFKAAVLGSVATRVAARSDVPLLLVR
jgi:nucleotide-binding universal stress UspA family protein